MMLLVEMILVGFGHWSLNPLNGRSVIWLHFAIQVLLTFLISNIRALWHLGLSARVPDCQKLKM